jgi:hypothetical protein
MTVAMTQHPLGDLATTAPRANVSWPGVGRGRWMNTLVLSDRVARVLQATGYAMSMLVRVRHAFHTGPNAMGNEP